MALRLPDGSIQMADGRVVYANSVILAADMAELMPLFTPPPAWPFVSGGGGGGGGAGTPGARGADGAPGPQGFQGTNPGVQGPQGSQGNQGLTGAGVQGPQGNQGNQGNQGSVGTGLQGPQGNVGIQGFQGFQGLTGAGAQGLQGFQGLQGPSLEASITNTIIQSRVVGTNADFFSVAALNLTLEADATDPFVYDINGTIHTIIADQVIAVTDNANNFVWIDDTETLGVSTLPCLYSFTAPVGPATDQHWFDLGHNQMMRFNGVAFVAVNRIFIGYVRADAGTINARYVCEPIGYEPLDRWHLFGTGVDGFLEVSAGTTTIDGTRNYTAIVVRGAGTLNHTNAITNSILYPQTQGIVAVIGTLGIDFNGLAYANNDVAGMGGAGGSGGGSNVTASVAGTNHVTPYRVVSFGGGAGVAASTTGNAGEASFLTGGLRNPVYMMLYGNHGSAGGDNGLLLTQGKGGGGMIQIAAAIAIGTAAFIRANGTAGGDSPGGNVAGNGGGGGGVIQLFSRNFFNDGTFTATAGAGGAGAGVGGSGGPGGAGAAVHSRI